MHPVKWFERVFDFSSSQNIFPSIVERLRGTPARLEERLRDVPESMLLTHVEKMWTIKEQIGHLIDLESLWQGRLDDIRNGKTELRATDLANTKTHEANHNETPIQELLATFRRIRGETLVQLATIDEAMIFKSALHPRMKTPMRTIDHFLFVAEHDDHHLASISYILAQLDWERS